MSEPDILVVPNVPIVANLFLFSIFHGKKSQALPSFVAYLPGPLDNLLSRFPYYSIITNMMYVPRHCQV